MIYENLFNMIKWKQASKVKNTLNNNLDLDLTYNEGEFFILAVENKNLEIVKILLDYFENNQLSKYLNETFEYKLLRIKICEILQTAAEGISLSSDLEDLLRPYIGGADSDSQSLSTLEKISKEIENEVQSKPIEDISCESNFSESDLNKGINEIDISCEFDFNEINLNKHNKLSECIKIRKKGDEAAKAKNYTEAMQCYNKAISFNDKYYTAYIHWGNVLLDLDEPNQAIVKYEEAIKIKKNAYSYRKLGDSYKVIGDKSTILDDKLNFYTKAKNSYQSAIDNKKDSYITGKIELADILSKLGDLNINIDERRDCYIQAQNIYKDIMQNSKKYKNLAQLQYNKITDLVENQLDLYKDNMSIAASKVTDSDEEIEEFIDPEEIIEARTSMLKDINIFLAKTPEDKIALIAKDKSIQNNSSLKEGFFNYKDDSGKSIRDYIFDQGSLEDPLVEVENIGDSKVFDES